MLCVLTQALPPTPHPTYVVTDSGDIYPPLPQALVRILSISFMVRPRPHLIPFRAIGASKGLHTMCVS